MWWVNLGNALVIARRSRGNLWIASGPEGKRWLRHTFRFPLPLKVLFIPFGRQVLHGKERIGIIKLI
jgi:hypothetical protein